MGYRKYATSHNHPQLPTTTCNYSQPPKTIHNYPENQPQPSRTNHNHSEITQKNQDLSQTVVLLHFRCS